jgi:hypothetical protein
VENGEANDAKQLEDHFQLMLLLSDRIPQIQSNLDECIDDLTNLLYLSLNPAKVILGVRLLFSFV